MTFSEKISILSDPSFFKRNFGISIPQTEIDRLMEGKATLHKYDVNFKGNSTAHGYLKFEMDEKQRPILIVNKAYDLPQVPDHFAGKNLTHLDKQNLKKGLPVIGPSGTFLELDTTRNALKVESFSSAGIPARLEDRVLTDKERFSLLKGETIYVNILNNPMEIKFSSENGISVNRDTRNITLTPAQIEVLNYTPSQFSFSKTKNKRELFKRLKKIGYSNDEISRIKAEIDPQNNLSFLETKQKLGSYLLTQNREIANDKLSVIHNNLDDKKTDPTFTDLAGGKEKYNKIKETREKGKKSLRESLARNLEKSNSVIRDVNSTLFNGM